ncbi:hypothetical protein sphantq_03543 [Sphingobium sp. AntQ-1]|nr:hypothetical protein sphantq_03543 [Sphingobium sp. AntQ-1]
MAGAHVHVLGSAPGACLPTGPAPYVLMAVNGSFLPWPTLVPDIVLLNGHTVVSDNPAQQMTRSLMRGRHATHVLAIADMASLDAFATIGLGWDSIEAMDRAARQRACEQATGLRFRGDRGDRIPSSGVTALCIAIDAGATGVTFSGISMEGGYSYAPGDHARKHIDVDRRALQALGLNPDQLDPTLIRQVPIGTD